MEVSSSFNGKGKMNVSQNSSGSSRKRRIKLRQAAKKYPRKKRQLQKDNYVCRCKQQGDRHQRDISINAAYIEDKNFDRLNHLGCNSAHEMSDERWEHLIWYFVQ